MDIGLLEKINIEIVNGRNEKDVIGQSSFFKEPIKTNGWRSPAIQRLAMKYFDKKWTKKEVFELCEALLKTGFMEQGLIACKWSVLINKQYEKNDFKIFDGWVKNYISNWAMCDTLCNHTIGDFITMYPEFVKELKGWSKNDNRWVKRASAVSFIIPAKNRLFEKDIFEIALILLEDKDDMVQKGYGWMLKSLSIADYGHEKVEHLTIGEYQKKVFDFVMKHKAKMPRTALRYAIEKLPKELKIQAMEK